MHYQQAMTSAEAAIAEDPTNPLAHRLAALAALGLEEFEAAGAHFDRAGELYPVYDLEDQRLREQSWIDLYNEAIPLINSGDYEASAELLAGANAIYKGRPEAMVTLGQIYAQLDRHDEAIEALDEAVAFVNGEVMAEVDSATAADWRESVADVPVLRAQVLAAGGRFEDAIAAYRQLAAADPSNLEYPKGIAALHMEMGNEAEALQVYADLLDRPGLSGQDLYAIGVGFYQGNDYERAARAFGATTERNPRDRDALELWARSLQLDSAFAQVPDVARRWIELDPNSQNAYLILAQASNALQDQATTQEAIRNVEALQVNVDQLTFRHDPNGGGAVTGALVNKQLSQGQQVTIRFTFYGSSGSPIGTVSETVAVGATGMSEVLQVDFESGQAVTGYGYQITLG
jgi:tetratricopeptide (TPR) repeat protein